MQRNGFDLLAGPPQLATEEINGCLCQLRSGLHELLQRGARQHHDGSSCERRGIRGSPLAIESGNFTKNVATARVAKRKHSTLGREHGKPNASFDDKVQSLSRVSSAEDELPRLIGGFAHLRGDCSAIRLTERAKHIRATEK